MATANEKRKSVANKYGSLIGRNYYDQSKRTYVFKKYTDGKYYSDCSSSICYSYREAGFNVANLNTAGMYNSNDWKFVDVTIKNGQITDTSKLRVGDILLFRGKDSSRPKSIGHVEMVYNIDGSKVTLCGHGSGRPKTSELKDYCTKMWNSKTNTPEGNRGLVCVKRFIPDDKNSTTTTTTPPTGKVNPKVKNDWVKRLQAECNKQGYSKQSVDGYAGKNTLDGCPTLKRGSTGNITKLLQEQLDRIGYNVNGIDGIFGAGLEKAVKQFQKDNKLTADGIFGKKSWQKLLCLS